MGDNSSEEAAFYRRAIALDPTYANAYFNLGFVYHSNGEMEKAIEAYRQCLRYDPKRYNAHLNLANCLLAVRSDAALYQVRHHLNLAIEIEEAIPPEKHPKTLIGQREELLDIECRINKALAPSVRDHYSYREIIQVLTRRVRRGGQTLYEGPRLPILIFNTGSDNITKDGQSQLLTVAKALNSPELVSELFIIEGHADARGSTWSNLHLSKRRAQTVKDWLVKHGGVNLSRLSVAFYGEDHPIYPNDSLEHYRYNRRIEIMRRYAE